MNVRRLCVYGGVTSLFFLSALAAARPTQTAIPRALAAANPVTPSSALMTATPLGPSPLPSNVATPSPLFANKAYFYRGEDNDPKKHPVPPEVQSGFKRDNHIYCLDWYRMPRSSHQNDWSYYLTTCQCYPEFILRSFGKGKD